MRFPILAFLLLLCTCVFAQNSDRKILIRTEGTINVDRPLFIVDGLSFPEGSIHELNPNDIETISVLKDASATTVYGPAGANGVVIITTKSGDYTRPSYTLTQDEIPEDIFTRYAKLNFGAGKEMVYLLDGKPASLKKLRKLDASTITAIKVYEGTDKAKRMGQTGKELVVVINR